MLERMPGKPETPADQLSGLSLDELDRQIKDLGRQFQEACG